jgi:cobalamin biosynthesis Mg chelatase CobN
MHKDGEEVHVSEEEASAGAKGQGVRYVLAIGLLLVIIALSAIWITGALTN